MDRRLAVLFVTAFVDMIGLAMIVPILPFYATKFGASATVVGLLISAFSVAQLFVAPGWGRLSDRYGRRPVILTGLLVTAVAYVIFALANTIPALLISRVVQGIGGGTIGVVQAYVADASPPEQRTQSLGWLSAITSLGAVMGPAFGSLMIGLGGQRMPGLAAAALASSVAAVGWFYLRESWTPEPAEKGGAAISGAAVIHHVLTRWHEPAPRIIWIYAVAIGAFYGTIQTVPLLLMYRFCVTEQNIGYFVMYLGGMGVVIRTLILGRMVDWLGEARLSRLGIVLLAAGLAATGLAANYPVLALGFTLMPIGTAFLFPCITGLLSQLIRKAERGVFLGVQHTFGGVSRVAFPLAAGVMMDRFGYGMPFWVAGAMVLGTLALAGTIGDSPGVGMQRVPPYSSARR